MTHDEHAGFIRSIIESPGCDLPRLVYADWLDENAGAVACPTCKGSGAPQVPKPIPAQIHERRLPNGTVERYAEMRPFDHRAIIESCQTCHGTGTVSNGFAERAEFIRVQCELAKWPVDVPWELLGKRERELFDVHGRKWFDHLPGSMKYGNDPEHALGFDTMEGYRYFVERGFVARVRDTLAVLVGGPCNCFGAEHRRLSTVHRMFQCDNCHGTGRTPGIAAEIIKVQPVESWIASDVHPTPGSGDVWYIEEEWCDMIGMESSWVYPDEESAMKDFNKNLLQYITKLCGANYEKAA